MAKEKQKVADAVDTTEADDSAPPARRPRKLRIVAAVGAVLVISSAAGGYFALDTLAGTPGETQKTATPIVSTRPMPVARFVPTLPAGAKDYQIVSVFDGEAILATSDNLVRVKVGSQAPGLGTITSVEASGNGGGTVVGTEATLRTL